MEFAEGHILFHVTDVHSADNSVWVYVGLKSPATEYPERDNHISVDSRVWTSIRFAEQYACTARSKRSLSSVEIDMTKLGKRKFNRGHHIDGQWIFGGVERIRSKGFIVAVKNIDLKIQFNLGTSKYPH